jgi:kynureninase
MQALHTKSLALTGLLRRLIEERLAGQVQIITPASPAQHGCQLSLRILRDPGEAKLCQQRITALGLIADWREPDIMRVAPTPLYNSYREVGAAVDLLAQALQV